MIGNESKNKASCGKTPHRTLCFCRHFAAAKKFFSVDFALFFVNIFRLYLHLPVQIIQIVFYFCFRYNILCFLRDKGKNKKLKQMYLYQKSNKIVSNQRRNGNKSGNFFLQSEIVSLILNIKSGAKW